MVLFDTAPIVAAAFRSEDHYARCVELFTGLRLAGRRLLLPATVAAEVGYLLDRLGGPAREAGFLHGVADGAFELAELTTSDYARMAELVLQYDDMHLGTTDASIVALAERLGVTEIATLDRRHFTAVRPRHVATFSLLPEQL
ncbi:PIN domain-containing protein [Nocardioides dubius]|uniref:Ribonuclease VapC n=1 Tax=Nocardioides dubius TaxID=317019 RepID=A0ABN1TPD7_9ACTN